MSHNTGRGRDGHGSDPREHFSHGAAITLVHDDLPGRCTGHIVRPKSTAELADGESSFVELAHPLPRRIPAAGQTIPATR